MSVLFVCDAIGGFIGVATDEETWGTAWGFDTHSTVPLPMAAVQLLLAWVAARSSRARAARTAALALSVICLLSALFGAFDGDLIGNVVSNGFVSWGFAWGVVLEVVNAFVCVLAFLRARELKRLTG